ncbi:DUF742 domain-containing protein [Amycolatopsis anabasis]|uniref:DUF742 domain-containing protein n=1 Tax=Amycolatopsis anabasis TaxID=1840409 RepID=UPI001FE99CF2|nr:DUF742 domain-containing protein [Amycolatopsis anabasis]
MSTGSEFFGDEPGAGRRPPEGGHGSAAGSGSDPTFADVLNGFTLNSGRGRRKRKKDKESRASHAAYEEYENEPPAETRPPDAHGEWAEPVTPAAEPAAPAAPGGLFEPAQEPDYRAVPPVSATEETAVVRPYALTGGRTKANYALELETLVSTKDGAAVEVAPEQIEFRSIVEECRAPRSVAELAAILRVPLGVARVLISDAADAGLVTVHRTISGNDGAEAHLMLMERVLSGLRRL